jgi:hypothetical protein
LVSTALVTTSPASGATLTLADVGRHPAIAVDDSGTGHVAWTEQVNPGDDLLHYCRLPRGATTCAGQQVFTLANEQNEGPFVLLGEGGEVILVASHCCGSGDVRGHTTVLRSADGGVTFGPPVYTGDADVFHGDVAFGPGTGQISTVGAPTAGVIYQAQPLAGPAVPYTQSATLLEGTAPAIVSSVAMLNPLTPAVAYSDFDDHTFARVYDGSGPYNDVANWGPPTPPVPGDEAQLAGGLRGLYLMRLTGQPGKDRYVVDRYDEINPGFAKTTNVSPKGNPIFRDFIQDAGGNLSAVWVQNDENDEPLYLRQSADGQTWGDTIRLAKTSDDAYNLNVGAASDGGGWAVWGTESGGGQVKAAPFDPIGAGGGGGGGGGQCVPIVVYGKVEALATEGCFTKNGNEYTTSGSVRINGLDLTPAAGGKAAGEITIDKGKGTLVSAGQVLVKSGNVELDRLKLAWNLPKSRGQVKDLAGNPATFDAGKANVEFLGLDVSGYVSPDFLGDAGSEIPVNLELPDPFGALLGDKITGQTTLRLDNENGLVLTGAEVRAKSIWLGIAEVREFFLKYTNVDPFLLQGSAKILLPSIQSQLNTNFGFKGGEFDYGNASLDFFNPDDVFSRGLPVVSDIAFLRTIGFSVETDPTKIAGSAVATGGPTITLGSTPVAVVTVNGDVSYTFSDPGVFLATGHGQLFNIDVADTSVEFVTDGKLTLASTLDIPLGAIRLSGSTLGEVSFKTGAFNLEGSGQGCGMHPIPGCVGDIKVLVSSKAASGCASAVSVDLGEPIGKAELAGGIAYRWGDGFEIFGGCDLSKFKDVVTKAQARRAARRGAPLGFTVKQGAGQVNVSIAGSGAPPRVTITGPNGETVTSGANPSGSATGSAGLLTQADEFDTAIAALPKAAAGAWTVDPLPGSPAITGIQQAESLPEAKVTAKVKRGEGRKRTVEYTVKHAPDQTVKLFESGEFGTALIGTAKGAHGKLGFRAGDGPGGKRTIEAHLEIDGIPRDVIEAGSYRAPGPIKPGKPGDVEVRRAGSRAIVTWDKAKNASGYIVEAAMKDGRRLAIPTKRTRLTIKDVPGIDSAKIKVAGLTDDNSPGKPGKARLKAKPKRRHGQR